MTIKTPIGILPENQTIPGDSVSVWNEARLAYPLYAALAKQFDFAPLPHPVGEFPPVRPDRDVFDKDLEWLDGLDGKIRAFQIRQLASDILHASEESLRAFIQRQLKRPDKTAADRDKIDFLLVQYFALCAPEPLYRGEVQLSNVAGVLQPVLIEADATPLAWCEPLEEILRKLPHCQSLRDIMENGLFEQGRLLKDSAGPMFYDPAALVAFCRFNFLLRRTFIRLLHADLNTVTQSIESLEANGVRTVDCRRAGFSAAETTKQLRYYCENWRQPFHKDYTENSVTRTFEQLLALRTDLEEALAGSTAKNHAQAPSVPANDAKTVAEQTSDASPTSADEVEKCLKTIWNQLSAESASRGRVMSTVILGNSKVMLSSWEVEAFVGNNGPESGDLRHAVVARALLTVAMDARKRSGELNELRSAILLARGEIPYFQGRMEEAKQAQNTEVAVNLGISTKRLLSFLDEAEKLQP